MWNRAKTTLTIIILVTASLTAYLSFYLKAYVQSSRGVTLTVVTNEPEYYVNTSITIYFVIRNENDAAVTLNFESSYQIDYEIIQDSKVIYKWSSNKGFFFAFTRIPIPAHGTVVEYLEHTSEDFFLKEGTYEIYGFLNPCCGNYSDTTSVTVFSLE